MNEYHSKAWSFLKTLCRDIGDRSVGSEGNREATWFFKQVIKKTGWQVKTQEFEAMDWKDGGAALLVNDQGFDVHVSPYSLGVNGKGFLTAASTLTQLQQLELGGKIVLLHGEIASEQLMPKNFKFYNPEEHQQIIKTLEDGQPKAIVCATGRNASLAGGVYPFPLIEDGDFGIPSVYMTEEEGEKLLPFLEDMAILNSNSVRIPGVGYNVVARKGNKKGRRVIITAHIDAKKGTPGAIDNATGVVILLLLADLLSDYDGENYLEIVAFNGEDYYSAPGQMVYLEQNLNHYEQVLFNINIDGAGYKQGKTAFSYFDLPDELLRRVKDIVDRFPGIKEGSLWYQGDHSIFIQNGISAVAVSSDWFIKNIDDQDITHTPKDNLDIVSVERVVEIAQALNILLR